MVVENGWDAKPLLFELSLIKKEFVLKFTASLKIAKHLEYLAK